MIYLWPFIVALLNRLRGGFLGDRIGWGTTVARLSTSFLMLVPLFWSTKPLIVLGAVLLLYVGFLFGWKAWQAIDSVPNDLISMGIRGLVITLPIGLLLGKPFLALLGVSMGLWYMAGKYLPYLDNVEWGEILFGFLLGLGIIF